MARIPVVRFSRVAAAFDEVARVRLCESSGSEHSPELSDLVNSFIERDGSEEGDIVDHDEEVDQRELKEEGFNNEGLSDDTGYNLSEPEKKKDALKNLLTGNTGGGDDDDDDHMIKRKIYDEAEVAYGTMGLGDMAHMGSHGVKRRLMSHLREKGFDAGLCKSKWEKSKRFPAGDYEYVDVNVQGTRYIVEAFLVEEFEIARPTDEYASLLEFFPRIFVGKVGELKQIVRLMCTAIKQSMRRREMPVPPWRRNAYMQTKWFGSYKRTTNSLSSKKGSKLNKAFDAKRSVGFETLPVMPYFCRGDVSTRVGLRVGNLTAAFNG